MPDSINIAGGRAGENSENSSSDIIVIICPCRGQRLPLDPLRYCFVSGFVVWWKRKKPVFPLVAIREFKSTTRVRTWVRRRVHVRVDFFFCCWPVILIVDSNPNYIDRILRTRRVPRHTLGGCDCGDGRFGSHWPEVNAHIPCPYRVTRPGRGCVQSLDVCLHVFRLVRIFIYYF